MKMILRQMASVKRSIWSRWAFSRSVYDNFMIIADFVENYNYRYNRNNDHYGCLMDGFRSRNWGYDSTNSDIVFTKSDYEGAKAIKFLTEVKD